jgi:hypothetical protein
MPFCYLNIIREEITMLEHLDEMSYEELKEYADSFDWDETKGYNLIDWDKDDLDVVREKLKARIKQDD